MEDAMVGKYEPVEMAKKNVEQRAMYIQYENMVFPERLICVLLLTLVSFVEIPLWCLGNARGLFEWENGHDVCAAPGHAYLSGTDYLPLGFTLGVELACVAYLSMLVGMEMSFGQEMSARFKLRCASTGLMAADVVIFGTCVVGLGVRPDFRAAPYLRVGLLVANVEAIFSSLEAAVALTPAFCNVSALLALCVCFFGGSRRSPSTTSASTTARGRR